MTRWSACIEMLFATEYPVFADRVAAAKSAGFDAVEFWATSNKGLNGVQNALSVSSVSVAGILAEPRPKLCDPSTHREFLNGLPTSVAAAPYAKYLKGEPVIVAMVKWLNSSTSWSVPPGEVGRPVASKADEWTFASSASSQSSWTWPMDPEL